MRHFSDHLIPTGHAVSLALEKLNFLSKDLILFVVDENQRLLGSLTDGDVRRGLLKGLTIQDEIDRFIQPHPKFIRKKDYSLDEIIHLRDSGFMILPVLDENNKIVNVVNFRFFRSYLPLDAVIMAGGRGSRLSPWTDTIPKPLLKIGNKPIMEHNVDRLRSYGVDDVWVSVGYLGDQIVNHFKDGSEKNINIDYIWEDKPLGTIGAASKIEHFKHDHILITNSDILTNMDYEDFYLKFLSEEADMAVATIPYMVDVPYAVMETSNNHVLSFKEKPTYTYYSNAGVYLIKKELLKLIPRNCFFNSTDLMQEIIAGGMRLISYPLRQYWLDVGKPEDFEKAKQDVNYIEF